MVGHRTRDRKVASSTPDRSAIKSTRSIVAGTVFRLGEQKLLKNNQDNQIQGITLCNMYFLKKVHAMYNGVWGKAPEAGEFVRIFVLKVTLQSVRLLLTVSYRKKIGGTRMYYTCSPNNFVRGSSPQFPRKNQSMDVNVYTDH